MKNFVLLLVFFVYATQLYSQNITNCVEGNWEIVQLPTVGADNSIVQLLYEASTSKGVYLNFTSEGYLTEKSKYVQARYNYRVFDNFLVIDNTSGIDNYGNKYDKFALISPIRVLEITSINDFGYMVVNVYNLHENYQTISKNKLSNGLAKTDYQVLVLKNQSISNNCSLNKAKINIESLHGDWLFGNRRIAFYPFTFKGELLQYCNKFYSAGLPGKTILEDGLLNIDNYIYLPLETRDSKLLLFYLGRMSREYKDGKFSKEYTFKPVEVSNKLHAKYGFFEDDDWLTTLRKVGESKENAENMSLPLLFENKNFNLISRTATPGNYFFNKNTIEYNNSLKSNSVSKKNMDVIKYLSYSIPNKEELEVVYNCSGNESLKLTALYDMTIHTEKYIYLELKGLFIGEDRNTNHYVTKIKERIVPAFPQIGREEHVVLDTSMVKDPIFQEFDTPFNNKKWIHLVGISK
jgi:hypothetical protein